MGLDGVVTLYLFFFSSRRRHTRCSRDWSSDVCSSDLHSHGRKFAAADSRHLSAGAGGLICPSWKRRLSGIAEGITSLPLRGSAKDRKSTRLNSSHGYISYAVFCLKKKKNPNDHHARHLNVRPMM